MTRLHTAVALLSFALIGRAEAQPPSLEMEELTWPEVKDALSQGWTRALIAVGSTEQHGPAIALASDSLQGEALGEAVARELGRTLLAPTVRLGVAPHHLGFPGTLSVRPGVLIELLLDQCRSLAAHGFTDVLLLPTHGGNFEAVAETARRAASEVAGTRVLGFSDAAAYLSAMRRVTDQLGVPKEVAGGHAGQMEASIVLAIRPESVRLDRAAPGYLGDPDLLPESAAAQGYHTVTPNGAVGDPRGATAEKGRAYLTALTETVAAAFRRELEPSIDGVWSYRRIESRRGAETLTGLFIFRKGRFVQAAIHDGEPWSGKTAQGHAGTYRTDGDRLQLEVELQIVVDPGASPPIAFSESASHTCEMRVRGTTLTLRFPSGTVQELERLDRESAAPAASYRIVERRVAGEARPLRGSLMVEGGSFAYAAFEQDAASGPSSFLAGAGNVLAKGDERHFSMERFFEGSPLPAYGRDVTRVARLVPLEQGWELRFNDGQETWSLIHEP
jgi:creatinine amidohydrolase